MEVHEHVLVDGRTAYLDLVMEHYAYPDVDTFLEKVTATRIGRLR